MNKQEKLNEKLKENVKWLESENWRLRGQEAKLIGVIAELREELSKEVENKAPLYLEVLQLKAFIVQQMPEWRDFIKSNQDYIKKSYKE